MVQSALLPGVVSAALLGWLAERLARLLAAREPHAAAAGYRVREAPS